MIVGQEFKESIGVYNGLCQGCTMACAIQFVFYSSGRWLEEEVLNIYSSIRYKCGYNLVGDRTTKSQLLLDVITDSQFADDAILFATSEESL